MRPWLAILLVALAIVIIIAAALYYRFIWTRDHILDGPGMEYTAEYYKEHTYPPSQSDLVGCEYRCTGGMGGEWQVLTLTRTDAGCELVYEHLSDPLDWESRVTDTYQLPAGAMETAQTIFRDRGVEEWPTLVEDDMEVLDAPTISVTFRTADWERTFERGLILPYQGGALFRDVEEALTALLPDQAE